MLLPPAYSGLFGNRTFPDKQKISPESKKKNGDYSEIHISGVNWNFKICNLIGQIQNWAFQLDSQVWLSAMIVEKSPLYFELEGVYKLLKLHNAMEESNSSQHAKQIVFSVLHQRHYEHISSTLLEFSSSGFFSSWST